MSDLQSHCAKEEIYHRKSIYGRSGFGLQTGKGFLEWDNAADTFCNFLSFHLYVFSDGRERLRIGVLQSAILVMYIPGFGL